MSCVGPGLLRGEILRSMGEKMLLSKFDSKVEYNNAVRVIRVSLMTWER